MSPRASPKRRDLLDAHRIERNGPDRRARTLPAIGSAVASRNGASLPQELRTDDRIGRTAIDGRPEPLTLY